VRLSSFVLVVMTIGMASPGAAQVVDTSRRVVAAANRAEMERRFRARLAQVVRTRLQLTDVQARQLAEVDQRLEPERRRLMLREHEVHRQLRQQLSAGDTANQQVVARLLDEMLAIHRDRGELIAREQRELARFLTPVQRAKYVGLQAGLRHRVEGMRRKRGGPGIGGPGRFHRRVLPPPGAFP
jgi:Spy/CpxP family protein refolding chaperone